MMLNELQIEEIKRYLKKSGINNRLIFVDFLDHLCCMIEQNMDEGATFDDSLKKALSLLPDYELKSIELYTLKLLNMETTFSSRTSMLATIPFGLFGLFWTFSNTVLIVPSVIQSILFSSSIISMFVLLTIGWINNFPRWSFPAIGFCFVFSLFFMNVAIPGISGDVLGFWAWTPLVITLIIAQLFKSGSEPLKNIYKKTKEEPFLIIFSFYGFTPFLLLMLSDEIYTKWMIIVSVLTTIIISSGVYLFLSSEKRKLRILSIVLSGITAIVITYAAS